jgi:hypothetical protein
MPLQPGQKAEPVGAGQPKAACLPNQAKAERGKNRPAQSRIPSQTSPTPPPGPHPPAGPRTTTYLGGSIGITTNRTDGSRGSTAENTVARIPGWISIRTCAPEKHRKASVKNRPW